MAKFIRVRHGDQLPLGKRVELAFADKYSPKDGPSAAVVCALLTDSIVTGDEIDPEFAATGDMTATGEIRPIGPDLVQVSIKKDGQKIDDTETNFYGALALAERYLDQHSYAVMVQMFTAS